MDYRERLRNIREDRDLTQAELGKVLDKSQQGYNHIEIGRAELKIDDLVKLCRFYDLSADYLIGLVLSIGNNFDGFILCLTCYLVLRNELFSTLFRASENGF